MLKGCFVEKRGSFGQKKRGRNPIHGRVGAFDKGRPGAAEDDSGEERGGGVGEGEDVGLVSCSQNQEEGDL